MVTRAQTARDSDRARRAFNSPHARQSKRRERSWIVDKSELDRRVEEEAGKAFERWDHFDGDSRESMPEAVRPLVERIVELEQAPEKVDAAPGETLIKRVGREVGPALDRWQACNDGNHNSMAAAIGPLVAANMGLEDEIAKLNREIYCLRADLTAARDSGQAYADKLTAVQRAKTDQAIEIERLREDKRICREGIKAFKDGVALAADKAHDEISILRSDLTRERETVRKLLADNAALETTVDVLAGRLAARGQS